MTDTPLAVHLAAGEGTRLRPLTENKPKPLVELGGTSLLERNIEILSEVDVTDQLVVTGYEAEQIEVLGYDTVHNPIYDETDMVYSLFRAQEQFPDDRDLLISYGDIVYEKKAVASLLNCDAPVCVVIDTEWRDLWELRFDDPLEDAETLRMAENGQITDIGAEPDGYEDIEGQYIGLIKIRHDHLEEFGKYYDELSGGGEGLERSSVEMTHFIQHLIDEGWHVQGVPIEGGWAEVDTLGDLETYRDIFVDNNAQDISNELSEFNLRSKL